jgi:hypothetical protein
LCKKKQHKLIAHILARVIKLVWLNYTFEPLSFKNLQFLPHNFQNSTFDPLSLHSFVKSQFLPNQRYAASHLSLSDSTVMPTFFFI